MILRLRISLLVTALVGLSVAQDLRILPQGDSQTRALKKAIIFTCSVTGSNTPDRNANLKWYDKEDQEINTRTGRLYVENDGNTALKLYITSIENQDAGKYMCRGDVDGNRLEKPVSLEIYKGITFDHAPSPQHPKINTDATIECRVSGQPSPSVSWRYRGNRIDTGPNERYQQLQEGLRIVNITKADDGEYLCRGEVPSDGRYQEKPIRVDVHIPPTVLEGPGQQQGIQGQEVSIMCRADGLPPPKYNFFKDTNDFPVVDSERISVDRDAGVVDFRPLEKGDEGRYRCVAENDVGTAEITGDLKVQVPPKIYDYRDVIGEEGKAVTLTCLSEGDPPPNMVYHKIGSDQAYEMGENDGGRIRIQTPSTGRLEMTIEPLKPEDTANYTCRGNNEAGEHKDNATIVVKFAPQPMEGQKTEFYIWAGKTRNMTCGVRAEPMPVIEWLRDGRVLSNNETYKIFPMKLKSNLLVTVREEYQGWVYGTYTCRARNEMGTGKVDIELLRATRPDPPKVVNMKNDSPTMVTLTVVPPDNDGGVAIFGYRVEYRDIMQDFDLETDASPGDNETMNIENLDPGMMYIFRVRAKNEVGVSESMEHSHKTDTIREPFAIVLNSPRVGLESTEYKLSWDRPRTGGVPIKEYEYKYRKVKMSGNTMVEPLAGWSAFKRDDDPKAPTLYYMLEGLEPDTSYEVEIIAVNDIGPSLKNRPFYFSTSEAESTTLSSASTGPPLEEGPDPAMSRHAGLGTGAVIGIVIIVFLVFLVIVDVSCYFMNQCGVLMCLCVNLCGKTQPAAKEKMMEEGESKEVKQVAPVEEAKVAPETEQLMPTHVNQDVDSAPPAEGDDDKPEEPQDRGSYRKSAALSHHGDEKWNQVVQELEKELRPNGELEPDEKKPLNEQAGELEPEDKDPIIEQEAADGMKDDDKDDLKEELKAEDDANERTALTADAQDIEIAEQPVATEEIPEPQTA